MHAFVEALKKNNVKAVKKWVTGDTTSKLLNTVTKGGDTALISAIEAGNAEIVEVLLHAKADPNLRGNTQNTPLSIACVAPDSSFSIPRLLIAHKAQLNDVRVDCSLPLANALRSNNRDLAQFLLDANASVNPPASEPDAVLAAAVESGNLSLVEWIINQYPLTVTTIDARVIRAAYEVKRKSGSMHMLAYFTSGAGNVFQVENKGALESTLSNAITDCDAAAVQCLIDLGAPVYDKDDAIPVLHEAVIQGWVEGVRMLIAHGADVNQPVLLTWTETLLGIAAENGELEVCRVLLEARADPNVVVMRMPLHVSVENNNWPLVELLLQHGADPNIRCQRWSCIRFDLADTDKTAKELVVIGKTDERIINALFAK